MKDKIIERILMVLAFLAVVFFAMLVFCSPARSQVVDTVWVNVEGDVNEVRITEFTATFHINDTVQFMAQAYDSDGDPVNAVYSWASSDTTIVWIDQVTGLAIGRRKGAGVAIAVMAEPITEVVIAEFRDGQLDWSGHYWIWVEADSTGAITRYIDPPSGTIQLCAYAHKAGNLVAESPGPPICPIVFTPENSEPQNQLFKVVYRTRPLNQLRRLRQSTG